MRSRFLPWRIVLLVGVFLTIAWMTTPARANETPSYWIWSGLTVDDIPDASGATLYIYQGLLTKKDGKPLFLHKGLYPYPIERRHVRLVFRMDRGVEANDLALIYAEASAAWARHGVIIEGLQVDSDWPTARLAEYALFLGRLRHALPQESALGVTGLGDWIAHGDQRALHEIAVASDGIVFQMYRKRSPIEFAADYTDLLSRADFPFELGLLPGRQDDLTVRVQKNGYYHGNIYFVMK